jgi:hypothetical protein
MGVATRASRTSIVLSRRVSERIATCGTTRDDVRIDQDAKTRRKPLRASAFKLDHPSAERRLVRESEFDWKGLS